MPKKKTGKVLLIRGVPDDIKKSFKAYCAKKEIPMRTVLINFMKRVSR